MGWLAEWNGGIDDSGGGADGGVAYSADDEANGAKADADGAGVKVGGGGGGGDGEWQCAW